MLQNIYESDKKKGKENINDFIEIKNDLNNNNNVDLK
jgi:hypothetical protein